VVARAVLIALLLTTACQERPSRRDGAPAARGGPIDPISVRVSELLRDLHGGSRARAEAIEQIRGLTTRHALDPEEGIALLRSLPDLAPAADLDPQTAIVAALAEDPRMSYLPVIEEVAARLAPAPRIRAIALVGMIDDPTAARTFLRLLGRFPDQSPSLAFAHLRASPQQARVLFPALLPLASHPMLFRDILSTALAYCDQGRLPASLLAREAPQVIEAYHDARDLLLPAQRWSGTAWMYADSYAAAREDAIMLLDLMGCLPADLVAPELHGALSYQDPRLLYTATRSLLTHGEAPPAKVLDRIAASDETRVWLWQLLQDAGRFELFPARWRTQEALAASSLAEWLARPDQLGRPPDDLELVEIVPIDAGPPDGVLDFFVFRFHPPAPQDGARRRWLAGVAGPYLRKDAPTIDDHGGTFSAYEPLDAKPPAGHVGEVKDILADWREYRGRR